MVEVKGYTQLREEAEAKAEKEERDLTKEEEAAL